jgi:PPOX class probable F420-dependent enzyme
MRLRPEEIRRRAAAARVCRIATTDDRGDVHVVPLVFALDGNTIYSSSDAGSLPKRHRNLAHDARATVLIDVYDEDWSRVWWVRARGEGRVVADQPERERARGLLRAKYPQFADALEGEGDGDVLAVDVDTWSGWAYAAADMG